MTQAHAEIWSVVKFSHFSSIIFSSISPSLTYCVCTTFWKLIKSLCNIFPKLFFPLYDIGHLKLQRYSSAVVSTLTSQLEGSGSEPVGRLGPSEWSLTLHTSCVAVFPVLQCPLRVQRVLVVFKLITGGWMPYPASCRDMFQPLMTQLDKWLRNWLDELQQIVYKRWAEPIWHHSLLSKFCILKHHCWCLGTSVLNLFWARSDHIWMRRSSAGLPAKACALLCHRTEGLLNLTKT